MHGFQQGAQLLQHQQQPQCIQVPNIHPVGPDQLQQAYKHGIPQPPLSHQQPWYPQPQHGVQQPLPGKQQPCYTQTQHSVKEPLPGQQQPQYTQTQHSVKDPPPGQQQPWYTQAQYGNQHQVAGQQYHTNMQLQQPPPSGQFTRERQGILRDK